MQVIALVLTTRLSMFALVVVISETWI